MKKLLLLWDPENPMTPVGPVVDALRDQVELREVTFAEVSHRTLPNRNYEVRPLAEACKADGLLWIEGGPLPGDLGSLSLTKACWLLNAHHEPTLLEEIAPLFDRRLIAHIRVAASENFRFVPVAAASSPSPCAPPGLSLLLDDPKPASHARIERALRDIGFDGRALDTPVVFCIGQGGEVHPMFFEALRSGAAVVADPHADMRGLVHLGEHAEAFPEGASLHEFLRDLAGDRSRLQRLADRGLAIVEHLHTPALRAKQVLEAIWPSHTILGGEDHRPSVSILVTCYRYLRRLKICLESLARQDLPPGTLEIVVADPASPDGLAGYLATFAQEHPAVRVVHLPLDARYHRNRGVGINRAFDASSGEVIVSIDGDIIFPAHLIGRLADRVRSSPDQVFGVGRIFLPQATTERVLSGETDPFLSFEELCRSDGDGEENPHVGVLGYCQAVHRSAFARARYPEEFDRVNQSDIVFVERLGKWAQVQPKFLEDESVLHLWHPRNWMGTNQWL
jgi:hypothetical protein